MLKVWKTTFFWESQLSVATYEITKVLLYPIHSIWCHMIRLLFAPVIYFSMILMGYLRKECDSCMSYTNEKGSWPFAFQVLPQVLAADARGFRMGWRKSKFIKEEKRVPPKAIFVAFFKAFFFFGAEAWLWEKGWLVAGAFKSVCLIFTFFWRRCLYETGLTTKTTVTTGANLNQFKLKPLKHQVTVDRWPP